MKIRKAAALLAAVVLSLAGCGGQTQKPEQTAKPQPAPEQQPEQKDSMPRTRTGGTRPAGAIGRAAKLEIGRPTRSDWYTKGTSRSSRTRT
jgi:Flp pilus assembly protein TadD